MSLIFFTSKMKDIRFQPYLSLTCVDVKRETLEKKNRKNIENVNKHR